ncbi:hypothetical protein D9758_013070 [Tetrapyrgos nigripes]|uniref:P-loop containing nucleoside triphosphate hydrolase protein n=1 Tax=Tetrapyrgos nigripes TaxID=182062 RepID=A0A8H5FQC2_9AGAR|nr:hypothetical protein D9758_013070 [Tetrapyrgos nigripes]
MAEQVVLGIDATGGAWGQGQDTRGCFQELVFPAYAVLASAILLALHALLSLVLSRRIRSEEPRHPSGQAASVKPEVEGLGGWTIFGYMLARTLSSCALLGISVVIFLRHESENSRMPHAALCLTFAYTSVLAILSLLKTETHHWRTTLIRHVNTVHLVAFAVFAYRDLYPLTTFTETPRDAAEGSLLWVKIALLTLVVIVIPVAIPRQYVPYNPDKPEKPAPEQTVSILSLVLYNFMTFIIITAWKSTDGKITQDDLLPLPDTEYGYNLREQMFPVSLSLGAIRVLLSGFAPADSSFFPSFLPYLSQHLDPTKVRRRNLFFSIASALRKPIAASFAASVLRAVAGFLAPLAINKLLLYIETGGFGISTRPWVWISCLFLGPMIESLSFDWYLYTVTSAYVSTEAILTQLIFEHALRIRMKSETETDGDTATHSGNGEGKDDNSKVKASSGESDNPENGKPSSSDTGTSTVTGNEADTAEAGSSSTDSASQKRERETETGSTSTTTSGSGTTSPEPAQLSKNPSTSKSKNLVGKINNLATTDLGNITAATHVGMLVAYLPMQVILSVGFLWVVLGWSSFVGLACIIILFPIPGYLTKLLQSVQKTKMEKMDARIQMVTETMNILRMVKMFGWERLMNERIAEKRDDELKYVRYSRMIDLLQEIINQLIPVTLVMKESLTASKVFSSMVVFTKFQSQLDILVSTLNSAVAAKVSLQRVTDFLYNTELLDTFIIKENGRTEEVAISSASPENNQHIGFHNATFTWSNDSEDGTMTPSRRRFQLQIEELLFKRGCINLIVGPTGCGKTSILMALLSEMHFVQSTSDSWYNLPRDKGVAYAAQESWVQNATIKENIVFLSEFDEERYKKVLYQCALERDLALFEAGDATEVGEKGLTLSGGQKARVTLARAIYSNAEIILLDDVLAALDVHTSKWIVEKCFKGDLVKGRTILLVTHNLVLTQPIASFVVSVKDGRIASQGSVSDALAENRALIAEAEKEQKELETADEVVDAVPLTADAPKSDGKLIVAEEMEIGHLGWSALRLFLKALGGNHVTVFFVVFLGMMVSTEFLGVFQTWFLGYWAGQYEKTNPEDVNVVHYLSLYVLIWAFVVGSSGVGFLVYILGSIRASRSIHKQLVSSVIGTTLRWLDTTPTSRVITRCTKDINSVDTVIPLFFCFLVQRGLTLIWRFIAVVFYTPVFLGPGLVFAVLMGLLGQIFMKAQLPIKRLQSITKAPVLGHFGAAIAGLTSIRAYGAQESVKNESLRYIDGYTRPSRTYFNLNRWADVRIDALANLFSTSVAVFLVYFGHYSASDIGFSLNMAVGFSGGILHWIRISNMFETQANSLERIDRYTDIEQEPKPTKEGVPPAYWPSSGELRVERLSARYSPEGPKVLQDISFQIASGERIGVVGRTGSGKSSLMLSLLRCIYTDGEVYYDGIPTASINLEDVRSNITIIPQVPELLSGTVRKNLDPFEQYDDAILNDALRASGLQSVQSEDKSDRITLDTAIAGGGSNLSVGQRQILALARAMVRGSKLLILDEATSAIDYKTDTVIQSSLRTEFKGDVSLITVAHRLQTIMDADKIMVLDAGNIVEFDKPSVLLQNPNGKLRALVDESADRERLYSMAGL